MKKNRILKLAALVLVLTLVTTSLVSGTYAKYATEFTSAATATVAKWEAKFEGKETASTGTFTFDLFETFVDDGVDGKLLAPGTEGSFKLTYDTNGTRVARNVKITMSIPNINELEFLKFYDADNNDITTTINSGTPGNLFDENFAANATNGDGDVEISWVWPFDNSNDVADTADGMDATEYPITVTFTATQLDVAVAP